MGLSSKLAGYTPGSSQANAQPGQHQSFSHAQQQSGQPNDHGYPPAPSQHQNVAPYSTNTNYAQPHSGIQQQSPAPNQPASGFPTIKSGLNASFNPHSQPSRYPSLGGTGAAIPVGAPSHSHQPQYGAAQSHHGAAPSGTQYPPQQQQYSTSTYGQPTYVQAPAMQQQAPPMQNRPLYAQPSQQQRPLYSQQPSHTSQGGPTLASQAIAKVRSIIQINGLQAFYPPQQMQSLERRLSGIDFRALARKWHMSEALAIDLSSLSLYDTVIYADDSTSMKYAEGGERIDDLKLILERVADVSTLFDDDGISIRAINSDTAGDNITTARAAAAYVGGLRFSGMTPLGTQMEKKILEPMVFNPINRRSLPKPVLVVTITDGEPTNEPEQKIFSVIKNAKKVTGRSQYGPKAVAFSFAQVGKDTNAQEFLGKLDTDRHVGDLVDCTSYYELEAEEYKRRGVILTPEIWMVKMLVGAVDPSYDEQDE